MSYRDGHAETQTLSCLRVILLCAGGKVVCRDGPTRKLVSFQAILLTAGGNFDESWPVTIFVFRVGFLVCALDSAIRFRFPFVQSEI